MRLIEPLITKIIDKKIGHWILIKDSPGAKDVLELSKQLHRKGKTWFASIVKIAETTENKNEFCDNTKK